MKAPGRLHASLFGFTAAFLLSCASLKPGTPPAIVGSAGIDQATGIDLVRIPGGEFTMGLKEGSANEKPPHQVRVNSFLIARTEVTVAQFARFVKATGYLTDAEKEGGARAWNATDWVTVPGASWRTPVGPCADDFPVSYLSWNDAAAYCAWAKMRLPTDAEWEYAAGGGDGHQYWAGTSHDAVLGDYAWFRLNSDKQLHPVGRKRPNAFGLHDMSGNVAEWCSDWYAQNYYCESTRDNPKGPLSGTSRILRGGNAFNDATRIRITSRGMQAPGFSNGAIGFRPCRDLAP